MSTCSISGHNVILVDSMLGKIARWCRMLGVGVMYERSYADGALASTDALVITRDRELYRHRKSIKKKTILLLEEDFRLNLAIIAKILSIDLTFRPERAYCSKCGGRLAKVDRDYVRNKLPERVYSRYSEYWVCLSCGQIYWAGGHHVLIRKTLENIAAIAERLILRCVDDEIQVIYVDAISSA